MVGLHEAPTSVMHFRSHNLASVTLLVLSCTRALESIISTASSREAFVTVKKVVVISASVHGMPAARFKPAKPQGEWFKLEMGSRLPADEFTGPLFARQQMYSPIGKLF